MARSIPEAFWRKSFLMPDGRYDGRKFEALAFRLLEKLHGSGWQPTALSHDGSRDFEKHDTQGKLWAECKAYSEKLSVYVLSPTLVMALFHNPHTVIIISRSDLNPNAVRHLAVYQAVSGKAIVSYDGAVLDHAIMSAQLYEYAFSGLPIPDPGRPDLHIRHSLSHDALLEPSELDFSSAAQPRRSARMLDTVRYGLVRLDLSIKNLSSTVGTAVEVQILKDTVEPGIRVVSFNGRKRATSITLQIPPAGIVPASLILQPIVAHDGMRLPEIRILGRGVATRRIDPGTLRVSNAYHIELVGATHRRTLEGAKAFLQNRRRSTIVAIEGASGTGKSRILQELARCGLEDGFRCHFYNPEFEDAKGAENVVRGLLADLSELPLMTGVPDTHLPDLVADAPLVTSLLTRVLFDSSFSIWDHLDEIVAAMVALLADRKTLLIIDNVQFTNERFIDLIDLLLVHLVPFRKGRVALVLAFNTDFESPDSRVGLLLRKLRAWGQEAAPASRVFYSRLTDFNLDDMAEFIQAAFSGAPHGGRDVRHYQQTLELFAKQVQPRPLHLWQSLMYLGDHGILSLEGDRLAFSGDRTLLSQLDVLPEGLDDLLRLRWARIQENEARVGISQSELNATARAVYLLGSETRDRVVALGGTERAIDRLAQRGLLSNQARGRVQFFHNQVFIFFRGQYSTLQRDVAARLKASFESLHLAKTKFQQYFLLCHYAGQVSASGLVATVRNMEQSGLTPEYWKQYADIVLDYFMHAGNNVNATSLTGVALIGEWQQRLESLNRGADTLREFLSKHILNSTRKAIAGERLLYFYTAATNACLATYDDAAALEVIDIAFSDLERGRFPDENQRNQALATILNRKVATLKNFGRADEAIEAGQRALKSFRQFNNRSMEVETLFDIASILVRVPERRSEGWRLMEEGCSVYRSHQRLIKEPGPCRYFYASASLALQEERLTDACSLCADGVRHAQRVLNHFWGVRLLLLEVAARLLSAPSSSAELEVTNQMLIRARDWANVSAAERSRAGIAYLDGKLLIRVGEHERASRAFSEAIANLATRLRTSEQLAWKGPLFRDIAATCRRHRVMLYERSIELLVSATVQAEMREILVMSNTRFAEFEQARRSEVLFHSSGETIDVP